VPDVDPLTVDWAAVFCIIGVDTKVLDVTEPAKKFAPDEL
jgi:hypothetical protein